VLTPNYRLAPEHPFPAAVEDVLSAYRWVLKQGIDLSQVVMTGTSAGGGLVGSLLVAARDAGDPLPAAAICLSPAFDAALSGASIKTNVRSDVMLQPEMFDIVLQAYLGTTDPRTPLASPLYADLHGLPPMLLQAGGGELLRDDAIRFAQRAREAGVEVELAIWEGMFHGWQMFALVLPEGRRALEQAAQFIRAHLP
jgi:monoterpene epsilon-lactone hydrolase